MTIYPSQEWSAALKRLQAVECECGNPPYWQITCDVTMQFSIDDDGTTDGEHYLGDEPRWSVICGYCGEPLTDADIEGQIDQDLTIIASDFV